jgi:hypothetical protein
MIGGIEMNKKLLAGIGISGAILLGSVYSISANTSGYELYKSALKQTHAAASSTLNIHMNLEDNNHSLFTVNSLVKADMKTKVSSISTRMANENEKSQMNMYKQNGNWFVVKEGLDSVYQLEMNRPHHQNTAELKDDMENLIDIVTKNLQQEITVSEKSNGNHSIVLDLTGKEIPLTANALSTLMIKHAVMLQDNNSSDSSNFHIKAPLPELNHEINVKQIKIAADVNKDNYIEKQTVKVVVTGKDKQGKTHDLLFNIKMSASDYNQTSVTPVDIPADKIIKLDNMHSHSSN